jgi:hypothetical protein
MAIRLPRTQLLEFAERLAALSRECGLPQLQLAGGAGC